MPTISSVNSSQPTQLNPLDANQMVNEFSEQVLTQGVNIGQLIVKACIMVEEASNKKAHVKIDELENIKRKLGTVSDFLNAIETELAQNPNAGTIRLPHDKIKLADEMNKLNRNKLFEKTEWTREEADALKTVYTRESQLIMQEAQHASSLVNRLIEEGTDLLQISRKVMDLLQQLFQTFTRNQRV